MKIKSKFSICIAKCEVLGCKWFISIAFLKLPMFLIVDSPLDIKTKSQRLVLEDFHTKSRPNQELQ